MTLPFTYDSAPGLIAPDFEHLSFTLPKKAIFAFLSEKKISRFAEAQGGQEIGKFVSITKNFPLYVLPTEIEPLLLMQAPVGAPAAVLMEERLFAYGVETILAIGCCGALTDLPENTFLAVEKAFREEGTSFHYLPPEPFITLDEEPLRQLESYFQKKKLPFLRCTTWSSDGFFRETKEKIRQRKADGCQVVDMECSALAACARFRKKTFAQILFTADTLAHMSHDQRNWGYQSRNAALALAKEALLGMGDQES